MRASERPGCLQPGRWQTRLILFRAYQLAAQQQKQTPDADLFRIAMTWTVETLSATKPHLTGHVTDESVSLWILQRFGLISDKR